MEPISPGEDPGLSSGTPSSTLAGVRLAVDRSLLVLSRSRYRAQTYITRRYVRLQRRVRGNRCRRPSASRLDRGGPAGRIGSRVEADLRSWDKERHLLPPLCACPRQG